MMQTLAIDRLIEQIRYKKNPCVVGMDPEWSKLPACYTSGMPVDEALWQWAKDVIDTTADIVPAVKPQMAFFEVFGADGIRIHQKIVQYAHACGLSVIDDSKRNDIGNTAEAYAFAHLSAEGPVNADFLTISPFLGTDSMQPFVNTAKTYGKGLFILVKTSNPGSAEISEAVNAQGKRIRNWLAEYIQEIGCSCIGQYGYSGIGAVTGATFPAEAAELRTIMPNAFFLVPGYGAQGGCAKDVVPCFRRDGLGAVVNASRSILYPHLSTAAYDNTRTMYLHLVRQRAQTMRQEVYGALQKVYPQMEY